MGVRQVEQTFIGKTKRYMIPSIIIITIFLLKLYLTGTLSVIDVWVNDLPLYTEQPTMGIIETIALVLLDMVIGVTYVGARLLNTKRADIKEEESEFEEDETVSEEDLVEEESETGLEDSEYLTVSGSLKKSVSIKGLERGFNFLWISTANTIILTVLWSVVLGIMTVMLGGYMATNTEEVFSFFLAMNLLRVLVFYVFKIGVLAFTTHATIYEKSFLQALRFTVTKFFHIAWIEIVYFLQSALIVTNAWAIANKTEKWSKLTREYERSRLYG